MTGLADAIRIIAVLAYAVVMMIVVWVVLAYHEVYRLQEDEKKRLLPHHVWVVGLSYLCYGGAAAGYAVLHFGNDLNIAAVLELAAGLIGIYGMKLVLDFERTKVK